MIRTISKKGLKQVVVNRTVASTSVPLSRSYGSSPEEVKSVLELFEKEKPELFALKFTDMHGQWMSVQLAISEFSPDCYEDGFYFDGSSVRGWQAINNSDMKLLPVASTTRMNPFSKVKTAFMICDIVDPYTNEPYNKDPRTVAKNAIKHLRDSGIAHTAKIGPEAEFFVFDAVSYEVSARESSYTIFSDEAGWTSGDPHSRYKIPAKEGYFPVAPFDSLEDLRGEMVQNLVKLGIATEASHHEVATAGQCEIDVRFNDLVEMCDIMQMYKYVVRNVGANNGKLVTFMPKPIASDNGSGMHTHVSLHEEDGTNLFLGGEIDDRAGLSEMAQYFAGGLIKHAKSVCAFSNPTINSYKRLVPGFEAPVNMAYSARNRSAALRIPASHPKARRIEFRTPDPTCNPYLSSAAIVQAGLDGIKNKIDPGEPLDEDIYTLDDDQLAHIPKAPGSLEEAIDELEKDHEFLTAGGVFSEDLIKTWIQRKREVEIDPYNKAPTPLEFSLYLGI